MIARRLAGLLALLVTALALAPAAYAQGATSLALPLADDVKDLYKDTTGVTVAGGANSAWFPITNPGEMVGLDIHMEAGATPASLTLAFEYATTASGPWVAGTDSTSSGYLNSITVGADLLYGANVKLFPMAFARVRLQNGGSEDVLLKRLSVMRRSVAGDNPRPIELVYEDVELLASDDVGDVLATATASVTKSAQDPSKIVAARWAGTGSAGNKTLQMRYSLSKDGPFIPWTNLASATYQNDVTATGANGAYADVKPFPAKYLHTSLLNSSGSNYTQSSFKVRKTRQIRR